MTLGHTDIHNHILPALDDGFQCVEDSLEAVRVMAFNGCRELIFTPHINPDMFPDTTESVCREAYGAFSVMIPKEWNVATHLAAEYMVGPGFENRVGRDAGALLSFPDGSVLIEMSCLERSRNLEQAVFELNLAGQKPILAHPERYLYMSECLNDFDRIVEMGCELQMSMSSLTGAYGPGSMRILNYLLKRKLYAHIATDLHSLSQLSDILAYRPVFFQRRRLRIQSAAWNNIS